MAPWQVLYIYRARMRARLVLVQELLAVLGLAVGVALLFASQVASTSLDGSIRELTSGVVGDASLQLVARDPQGFDERLLSRVRRLPGVRGGEPVLEQRATVLGPKGQRSVDLLAGEPRDMHLGGGLLRHFTATQLASLRVLALPTPLAQAIGVDSLQTVTLVLGASRLTVLMGAKLDAGDIGALVSSPVAIAPLAYAQAVTGMRGRVTRILVRTLPGRERQVRRELGALAAGADVDVEPADYDAQLFATAAAPADQSEELFSAISALVGFMFAFNAMLVTVHLRRGLVATLRRRGATRAMTAQVLLFDALVLGVLGSLLGLALGEALSIAVFRADPGYLAFAFAVGPQRIVTWQSVAVAVGTGVVAACVGVLAPLRGVLAETGIPAAGRCLPASVETGIPAAGRCLPASVETGIPAAGRCLPASVETGIPAAGRCLPASVGRLRATVSARPDGERGRGRRRGRGVRDGRVLPLALGAGCLMITTAILLTRPQSAVLGSVTLVVALLILLPITFDAVLAGFEWLQRPLYAASSRIALVELRNPATRTRSLAIAATGAIAVFGSVAIEGARSNLQHGLDASVRAIDANAAVWVSPEGEADALTTIPFHGPPTRELADLPGVRAVGVYRGGFLDWGDRRVWVLAPPRAAPSPAPAGQLVQGSLRSAGAALRGSGWAVLSQALAAAHHLRIGERFTLPSPRPTAFRVAALSTNLGWPPGAVVLNAADYARAWGSADASAYQVQLDRGASPGAVRAEIQRALGPGTGLHAETASQWARRHYATTRQALSRLTQIGALVLIASVLAMAGAMGSMIWQRRPQLAYIKRQGYKRGVLWRALLCESALLLGAGCLLGACFGIYGQLLLSHALASVTGFPIRFSTGAVVACWSFALVSAAGVAILAVPGYLAVRVRPTTVSTV